MTVAKLPGLVYPSIMHNDPIDEILKIMEASITKLPAHEQIECWRRIDERLSKYDCLIDTPDGVEPKGS